MAVGQRAGTMQAKRGPALAAFLLAMVLGTAGLLVGCAESASTSSDGVGTPLTEAVVPAAPDLSAPVPAVRSYLAWVGFSYRMANSEISSRTMTPYEGVRVDSYIQLNREKNQGMEQELTAFTPVEASRSETAALITASEAWRYRYFSLDKRRYLTPWYEASYDTTYSVIATQGVWLVASVEATALTPVK
ncbi:MAG: hypothetical protein Q7W16_01490 [Coriobacteriia bacterium]|nr:hypothetical protein [Coriobacteriia bacterium]